MDDINNLAKNLIDETMSEVREEAFRAACEIRAEMGDDGKDIGIERNFRHDGRSSIGMLNFTFPDDEISKKFMDKFNARL